MNLVPSLRTEVQDLIMTPIKDDIWVQCGRLPQLLFLYFPMYFPIHSPMKASQ